MNYQNVYEEEKTKHLSKLDGYYNEMVDSMKSKNLEKLHESLLQIHCVIGFEGYEKLLKVSLQEFYEGIVPIKGVELSDKTLGNYRFPLYIDGELAGQASLRTKYLEPTHLDKRKKHIDLLEVILLQVEEDMKNHKELLHKLSNELKQEEDTESLFYSKLMVKKTQTENAYNRCVSRYETVKEEYLNREQLKKEMKDKQNRIQMFADKYGFTVLHKSEPMK